MTMCKWCATGWLALGLALGSFTMARAADGDQPANPDKAAAKAAKAEAKADAKAAKADAKGAKADGEKQPGLKGYYAIMAAQLGLSEDQKVKVAELVKARDTADAVWQQENGEKLAAAKKAVADAKGDKDAAAKAKAEFASLAEARDKIDQDARDQILAVLTPEQREQWAGFTLYMTSIAAKFKKAELSEEQVKQIKALCVAAAKEIAPLRATDKQGAAAIGQIKDKLNQQIRDQVLTAEQRATLDAAAKAPKKGDAPGAAAGMAPADAPKKAGEAK